MSDDFGRFGAVSSTGGSEARKLVSAQHEQRKKICGFESCKNGDLGLIWFNANPDSI